MNLFWLILFVILIKSIESKKSIHKYILMRDDQMDKHGLSQFSVLDSSKKHYLYRLKTSYIDNDGLVLVSYPSRDTVGYVSGEWKNETLNVTFEIFDLATNESTNGTIIKIFNLFVEQYLIQWNDQNFIMKKKLFTIHHKFYDENQNVLAQFRKKLRWFNWSSVEYDLKIFIDKLPHAIYFFSLAIVDHRNIII
jgi:hypothetical protein